MKTAAVSASLLLMLTIEGIGSSQKQPEQSLSWEEGNLLTSAASNRTWPRSCVDSGRNYVPSIRIQDIRRKLLGTSSRLA